MSTPDRHPHDPADTCTGHCHAHGVDETGPGDRCPECGHLLTTVRDSCPHCAHDL